MLPTVCDVCIIGAGPAGLSAAWELTRHGLRDIIIVDRNETAGGLSRTITIDGARFDIGPHRFYTKNREVRTLWRDVLGDDLRPVSRLTRIHSRGRMFSYPITPADTLWKLGVTDASLAVISFLAARTGRRKTVVTFEDWAVQNFGRRLYRTFFKTYTEKIWGIPCSQISAEWAGQRIKGLDLGSLIRTAVFRSGRKTIKTMIDEFDYPRLGAGQMYETMAETLQSRGLRILSRHEVTGIEMHGAPVVLATNAAGASVRIEAGHLFSSMPLACLLRRMSPSFPADHILSALRYRDHVSVQLLIDKDALFPDQWLYVHAPDVKAARIANYNNFSRAMPGGRGRTALSVEYFASQGDELWSESNDSLMALAAEELDRIGLLQNGRVVGGTVIRETEAYPLHPLDRPRFQEELEAVLGRFPTLTTMGRAGLHHYDNQDHAVFSGLLAARNHLKLSGTPYTLWDINSDAEYLESRPR